MTMTIDGKHMQDKLFAGLRAAQAENEILRAGYDAARQEIASLRAALSGKAAMAPANAAGVRQAFDSYCEQVQHALPSAAPHDDDRYVLTAYDIVEALKNWNAT